MPARIRITRGINAGTTHDIHVSYLRIGSDLSCDFCIPSAEVPPVAVLVEYVGASRSYSVHCRSQDACYFNGRLMNPGDKRGWAAGQELAIGRTIGLELDLDADPSPAPPESRSDRQRQFIDSQIQNSDSEETASSLPQTGGVGGNNADPSVLIKIGIIIFCIFASVLAILIKAGAFDSFVGPGDDPIPTSREVRLELDRIDDENINKGNYRRLFDQAQRDEDRNPVRSRENYSRLRNMIYQDRELREDEKLGDKTIRYIEDRLKWLRER